MRVRFLQGTLEPCFPLPDICCSRIAGAICKPHRDIAALQLMRDLNAVLRVLQSLRAHGRIVASERSMLVDLILEKIRIDRPRLNAIAGC